MNNEEFEMNRRNASLFTFIGELAAHNHVFLVHEVEGTKAFGTYVWAHNEAYADISAFLVEHSFPLHLNMLEVAPCDLDAYSNGLHSQASDVDDGVPTDWL